MSDQEALEHTKDTHTLSLLRTCVTCLHKSRGVCFCFIFSFVFVTNKIESPSCYLESVRRDRLRLKRKRRRSAKVIKMLMTSVVSSLGDMLARRR